MAQDIWSTCKGATHICPLDETAWRLESEENMALRKLVDSSDEQVILQDMIESSYPPSDSEYSSYHPLLLNPFKHPPLKYGSRFGRRIEPALWYGSLKLDIAMSEKAFYKFNFLRASATNFGLVEENFAAFSAHVNTDKGIKLSEPPFSAYTNIISAPDTYEESQMLGTVMRKENIRAFTFKSARNLDEEINIALFTPQAFRHKKPDAKSFQSWRCIADNDVIEFFRAGSMFRETKKFSVEQFMTGDVLPFPAS